GSWTLGTIPAGGSVTVSAPIPVQNLTTFIGSLLSLEARVNDDSSHQSLMKQTIAVDNDGPITLAGDEDSDPGKAGGIRTYVLTYANRSSTALTTPVLSSPIPAGATFVSATGGGTLSGGSVQWNLATLPASKSDQQQVQVSVNAGLADGSILLVDSAVLAGSGGAAAA